MFVITPFMISYLINVVSIKIMAELCDP